MAALTVVMVLFFIMALVAAYTNRNLVFEQRISANSYRIAKAADAGDAGLEWTLAMLNGGRTDEFCVPTADPAQPDFRRRYEQDVTYDNIIFTGEPFDGGYTPVSQFTNTDKMYPACINRDGALRCICPAQNQRNPAMNVPADGIGSGFRIDFADSLNAVRTGIMVFTARGCASPGVGATACYVQTSATPSVDAVSDSQIYAGLIRALPIPPIAALTAGQLINANNGTLTVVNPSLNGLTTHAGLATNVNPPAIGQFAGPAGSGSDGRRINADLSTLSDPLLQADDRWFRSLFGTDRASFLALPATRTVACGGGCNTASLTATLNGYPRNPIYLTGDLTLDQAGALGSVNDPVLIIVNGNLTITANAQIFGFIHANNIVWSSAASVQGALVAAGNFTSTADATLVYRQDLLDQLRQRYGSFVRVPGSWKQL